ncbi:hypothetical protein, partial [Pandoraea cepalis]|uniref:hypothetical protein n=1 Tax=Pandoraea cepalis TaxID=2508294 RepID=UPI001C2D51EE
IFLTYNPPYKQEINKFLMYVKPGQDQFHKMRLLLRTEQAQRVDPNQFNDRNDVIKKAPGLRRLDPGSSS